MSIHPFNAAFAGDLAWCEGVFATFKRVAQLNDAFMALEYEEQCVWLERAVLKFSAGVPGAPFLVSLEEEADEWARLALWPDKRAVMLAVLRTFPPNKRRPCMEWMLQELALEGAQ